MYNKSNVKIYMKVYYTNPNLSQKVIIIIVNFCIYLALLKLK